VDGQELRERRTAAGLEQVAVARALGVTKSAVCHIEGRRHLRPKTVADYVAALETAAQEQRDRQIARARAGVSSRSEVYCGFYGRCRFSMANRDISSGRNQGDPERGQTATFRRPHSLLALARPLHSPNSTSTEAVSGHRHGLVLERGQAGVLANGHERIVDAAVIVDGEASKECRSSGLVGALVEWRDSIEDDCHRAALSRSQTLTGWSGAHSCASGTSQSH